MPRPPLKSKDAWEAQKERIHSIYIANNHTLSETIKEMSETHGFHATQREYVKRLKFWEMTKNAKKQDWKYVQDRDLDQKHTRVKISGKVIGYKRVKRATQRYRFAPHGASEPTPSHHFPSRGIDIRTPSPIPVPFPGSSGRVSRQARCAAEDSGMLSRKDQPGLMLHLERWLNRPGSIEIPVNTIPWFQFQGEFSNNFFPSAEDNLMPTPIWKSSHEVSSTYTLPDKLTLTRSLIDCFFYKVSHTDTSSPHLIFQHLAHLLPQRCERNNSPVLDDYSLLIQSLIYLSSNNKTVPEDMARVIRCLDCYGGNPFFSHMVCYLRNLRKSTIKTFLNRLLQGAVGAGNEDFVLILLKSGVDPHGGNSTYCPIDTKRTEIIDEFTAENTILPLQLAAMEGNLQICKALLDHGADPNALSRHMPFGSLELVISLHTGNSELAEILMKHDADVNMSSHWEITYFNDEFQILGVKLSQRTLLYKVVKTQNIDTTRMLILRGARLDSVSEAGGLPIQMAVRKNDFSMVKLLLESGADINTSDFDKTAGRYCAFYLEEIDSFDFDRVTDWWALFSPIQIAIQQNNLGMAKYLLNKGANIQLIYNWNTIEEQIPIPQHSPFKIQVYHLIIPVVKSRSQTALHHAAENGNIKMTELLIENGAIIDQTNGSGATPLQFVCGLQDGAFEAAHQETQLSPAQIRMHLAHALLNSGSNVNAPPGMTNGKTALQAAAERGDDGMVELLLHHGADIDALPASQGGLTVLQAAAKSRSLSLLTRLHSYGAQLTSDVYFIALYFAALAGDIPLINFVTQRYTNTSGLFPAKLSPEINGSILQAGIRSGNIEVVRLLLDANAEINIVVDGETAICTAARENHLGIFKLLMARGAALYFPNLIFTPLAIAVSGGYVDMVKTIVDAGADVNQLSHNPVIKPSSYDRGKLASPLYWGLFRLDCLFSYYNTHKNLLRSLETIGPLLLSNGANPNLKPNKDSRCPLGIACAKMSYSFAKALIESGADLNSIDPYSLRLAIRSGRKDKVQLLLKNGVDPNDLVDLLLDAYPHEFGLEGIRNFPAESQEMFKMLLNSGACLTNEKEMLARAIWVGYDALAWERIEAGDDVGYPFNCQVNEMWKGITPLQAAAYTRKTDFVRVLLDRDANPNPPRIGNSAAASPLQIAVADGDFNLTRLLIEKGADINAGPGVLLGAMPSLEFDKGTALQFAAVGGYLDIVHLLLENDKIPETIASRRADASELAEQNGHALLAQILRGESQI